MVKRRKKLHSKVTKIIKPATSHQKEKAQIDIEDADDLYREIRIENVVADEKGEEGGLKPGEDVDIVIETDSRAMINSVQQRGASIRPEK